MAHKFDPEHMEELDSKERKQELPPFKSLHDLGVKPGDIVADIGSGTGFLAFPAAEIVGPEGKVYAVDSSKRMLTELEKRIRERGVCTIETFLSTEYDFPLPDACCDKVLMSNVFHEVDDKVRFAKEACRILRGEGIFAVFEMKPEAEGNGPPKHHRVSSDEVRAACLKAGFSGTAGLEISATMYCVQAYR